MTSTSLQIGTAAPDFAARIGQGPIQFHQWLGDAWGVLIFQSGPAAASIWAIAKRRDQFSRRAARVLTIAADASAARIEAPVATDPVGEIASLYRLADADTADTSIVHVIDPSRKVRLVLTYPANADLDFDEIIRGIGRLQMIDAHDSKNPAKYWRANEETSARVAAVLSEHLSLPV
ncbi:MAG: redoxin domain-containing protein [Betaproteobacteria bacterium]|nr:redoxin domain-containing protein [Betaproteobacteria bacterium]